MIRVRLKEVIAEREFKERRSVTMKEVSEATGIHPVTLSKIGKNRGYNPTLEIIDRLCEYFDCEISDLLVRTRQDVTKKDQ
ncbi:helix-turn-helix transcriptional regulator [Spongiibacter sp. KMU-166]|uniref:Helix-turn-helix transcriptional regulator n=1 Tax=Spongiibacter thalassae TaxID=2721624 RepID=A0ABX1GC45_9GAMM|nr:helix-turn-helix transcriptional regulator [Spongiibacter thalassae]